MSPMPVIILPSDYRDAIARCRRRSGVIDLTISVKEDLMVVDGWRFRSATHGDVHTTGYAKEFAARHFLKSAGKEANGFWYHVDPDVHRQWAALAWHDACMGADDLRRNVAGWHEPGGGDFTTPVLTFAQIHGETSVLAWEIRHGQAIPARLDVVDYTSDRLAPLAGHWPTSDLADARIVVAGTGSIGSAACDVLATYGARNLTLIDPDHLYSNNFARHTTDRSQAGRFKVHAVADRLNERDDRCRAGTSLADVISDADEVRGALDGAAAVLVSVDGVEPRRVLNHLAVRAGVPAIFACVLANGRVGEVLRVLPGHHGCLLCHRHALTEAGVFDPEPYLDRGYGAGTRHLPMTAVGGDLGLVGAIAAKATVATVLERAGHRDQKLPGEQVTIGLRPGDLPEPYDAGLGETKWTGAWPARADCPTCPR